MSYDPTSFVGLSPGGDTYAPDGSHATYATDVTASDPDGQWIGPTFRCPSTGPGHTFIGVEVDPVFCPDLYVAGTDILRDVDGTVSGGDAYGDVPSADYLTVYVKWGDVPAGLRSIVGIPGAYTTTCHDFGSFGPECLDAAPIEYELAFENTGGDAGVFLPADVFGDGSYIADGDNKSLEGYLKPTSPVYAGDPSNTASALLWNASDVATLKAFISYVQFYAQEIDGTLTFTIRPFWKPRNVMVMFV